MKKHYLKRVMAILLTSVMVLTNMDPVVSSAKDSTETTLSDSETVKDALRLWYDEPVSKGNPTGSAGAFGPTADDNYWQQLSLPIGNSYLGANIYGEIGTERVTFNQKTLWNGGPSENRPNYNGGNIETVNYGGQTYEMSEFVKLVQHEFLYGDATTASNMCGYIVGSSDGYGAYQAFGEIQIDFGLSGTPTNYVRDLNLVDAVANVDFTLDGVSYHREYFASYPDNVIVMKMTSTSKMNDVKVSFPIDQPTNVAALGKTYTTTADGNKITVAGELNDNQMKFSGQLKVVSEGTVTANTDGTLTVSDAEEFVIIVSADTDYLNEYPSYRTGETDEELSASVAAVVEAAVTKGYDKIKKAAVADYKEIFDRVELNLGQCVSDKTTDSLLAAYNAGTATEDERRTLETLLFQYGRFLQIQSSRAGDLPANLQGVWNCRSGNENYVPWGSDYHMNVNLQMNYWPTYVTNMAECGIPLIDYVDSLREPGRVTAEIYFGVASEDGEENGYTAHTQNTPFGWTCPGWAFSWGWSPAAVPWILQNVYEYYEYTGDLNMLEEQIYPMLKEEAKLYSQILVEDPETGRMVTAPAYSPEHGPYTAGNTYEQSLVWQLFKDASEAADALGVDAELSAEWKELQAKTMPIEIGESGQIKEWYEETTLGSIGQQGHRHMSHLLGLYPGDLINFDNNEYLEAAIISLEDRGDDATGWGMGQRLNSWARVGDGNHAYDIIKAFFKSGAYPNLWDSHAPFQIDGNFGYTSGIAEMLIQSNVGYINLLPALPDVWETGKVSGLVARGNFEVSMSWDELNLTDATILSKNGGTCEVEYGTITKAKVLDENGKDVDVTMTGDSRISFETEVGKTYTITEIPKKPLEAPENAEAIYFANEAVITFDSVGMADSYNVYKVVNDEDVLVGNIANTELKVDDFTEGTVYKVAAVSTERTEGEKTSAIVPVMLEIKNKIDDRDERIKYSSGWGNWSDSNQYEGTEKYTDTTGSTLEFYFYGSSISVIGMKASNCNTFNLYIDGELKAENVNTKSSGNSAERQVEFVKIDDLEDSLHKVELVVTQAKISLDAFVFESDSFAEPTGLEVHSDSDSVNVGSTMQMEAVYLPETAIGTGVNWSVENEIGQETTFATISEDGVLTAQKAGKVVVKAVDVKNAELTAEKTISIVANGGTVKFDDRHESISYDSNWSIWNESKHYEGTETETTTNGASFTFDFTGTGIALYCMKLEKSGNTGGAQLAISIDGGEAVSVSTFTTVSGSEPQQKVFENLNLENGKHTVVVTVNGVASDASAAGVTSPKVCFDYYEVTLPAQETLDYSKLNEAVNEYRATDFSDYTEETVNVARIAYEEVLAAYETYEDQAALDQAAEKLEAALAGLTIADVPKWIPVSEMKATAGDYQSGEGPELAIDENNNTIWHTNWYAGPNYDNHWFMIELSSIYEVSTFSYLPRQNSTNGIITEYVIETSLDGETWTKVAEGNWSGNHDEKLVTFEPIAAKYVRLVPKAAMTDQSIVFTSAAEIRLMGKKVIECTNHNTVLVGYVAPTCTEAGYSGDSVCTICNQIIENGETIAAKGHSYGEWTVTKAATCTEAGEETRTCANDPEHTDSREIAAKGHAYGEWTVTKAATCTEAGEETRTCANDPEHTDSREIAAKGHGFGEWVVVTEPTEEAEGLEERVCSCGERETNVIPKLEQTTPDNPDKDDPDKDDPEQDDPNKDDESDKNDEQKPVDKEEDKSPVTGDNSLVFPMAVIMFACAMLIIGIVRKYKER